MSDRDPRYAKLRARLSSLLDGDLANDRERLLDELVKSHRDFSYNPSLCEALNSGDGTYKP